MSGSAVTIAARVRAGRLGPVAVCEDHLARIAESNPGLNALVNHAPERALAMARALLPRLAAGEVLPLAGVPVVVKDLLWVEGWPATQGSHLFADFIAPRDSLAVARLRGAGAVVIGLGNTSEFGCKAVTINPLHGPTRHPMDPTLTPGGSSGGCVAAVAAGMAPLALGTDGGGSSRRPPAHVGIVGFKPTNGAVADPWGFPGPAPGIGVICPIARTVADTALMFAAIAGPHPLDPFSLALHAAPVLPAPALRVAYSPRFGLDVAVDADVASATHHAVDRLRAAGLDIERADPPWPEEMGEAGIAAIELAGLAALFGDEWRRNPGQFDPDIGIQIEQGLALDAAAVGRALGVSAGLGTTLAQFLERFDLVIGPTTPCVAWPLDRLDPETIGGQPARHRGHAVFTPLFNHARVPAISIPCGAGRAGLPVGLQLVGRRLDDWQVLAAAGWAEHVLSHSELHNR